MHAVVDARFRQCQDMCCADLRAAWHMRVHCVDRAARVCAPSRDKAVGAAWMCVLQGVTHSHAFTSRVRLHPLFVVNMAAGMCIACDIIDVGTPLLISCIAVLGGIASRLCSRRATPAQAVGRSLATAQMACCTCFGSARATGSHCLRPSSLIMVCWCSCQAHSADIHVCHTLEPCT